MHRTLFISAVILSVATPAMAAAPRLVFRDAARDAREESVIKMMLDDGDIQPDIPVTIAAIDLNGDGVDEWIVRQDQAPDCQARARCTFSIAGLSDKSPVSLGNFSAGKIGIADEKTYGINRILVYNNANDDYAYDTFVWTPEKGAFAPRQ